MTLENIYIYINKYKSRDKTFFLSSRIRKRNVDNPPHTKYRKREENFQASYLKENGKTPFSLSTGINGKRDNSSIKMIIKGRTKERKKKHELESEIRLKPPWMGCDIVENTRMLKGPRLPIAPFSHEPFFAVCLFAFLFLFLFLFLLDYFLMI